ncbi:hypothetical protein JYK22_29230, partial [Nonomuraea sp. RK-328]|nr:hypothetical protein [Nonomuraea sp. RK-328]
SMRGKRITESVASALVLATVIAIPPAQAQDAAGFQTEAAAASQALGRQTCANQAIDRDLTARVCITPLGGRRYQVTGTVLNTSPERHSAAMVVYVRVGGRQRLVGQCGMSVEARRGADCPGRRVRVARGLINAPKQGGMHATHVDENTDTWVWTATIR